MKNNRMSISIFLLIILSVIGCSAYGMLNQGKEDDYISVSVIINDSSNARWDAFRAGVEQGAEDYHVHLNLVSTGNFRNAQEERVIVNRELDGDADGIIVAPYSSEADMTLPAEPAKPVVLVGTGIETDKLFTTVMTNHAKLGEALAEAAIEDKAVKIGILSGNQIQKSMEQRLKSAKKRLADAGVEISWVLSEKELNKKQRNIEYFTEHPVDTVISIDNASTEKAVDIMLNNDSISWKLYGGGRSEKLMYYLDKGLIQVLAVPNEYYIGYQCVALAAQNIRYYTGETEQSEIDFYMVSKENLYDEEISRILFPTVR